MSAAILANLEEDLKINVSDHFDLIAGTSTGGIIALALANGIRPREIVNFYVNNGPKIFKRRKSSFKGYFGNKFSSEPLSDALKECFGDKRIADLQKRVVIPSYSLTDDDVYIFRTPHHERLARDYRVPIWKAALATSSAPSYFPSCTEVDKARLVDGGVWANNPSMVALVEAIGTLLVPLDKISICSLGTSDEISERASSLTRGGKWHWKEEGVSVILRGQSRGAANQSKFFLGEERFERLDPKVAHGTFTLDGISKTDDLLAKGAFHSRNFAPTFKAKFCGHRASIYTPIHS